MYGERERKMDISKMDDAELEVLAGAMKAMSHPLRLKILCRLKSGRKNVAELVKLLGAEQAIVSQQLGILRLNGLVYSERERGFAYYAISAKKKGKIEQILGGLCGLCA